MDEYEESTETLLYVELISHEYWTCISIFRFRPNQFTVRVGEWDLSDNDNYVQEFRVVDIQAHPDFKPNGFYNDVALFILDQPVRFTEYVSLSDSYILLKNNSNPWLL